MKQPDALVPASTPSASGSGWNPTGVGPPTDRGVLIGRIGRWRDGCIMLALNQAEVMFMLARLDSNGDPLRSKGRNGGRNRDRR